MTEETRNLIAEKISKGPLSPVLQKSIEENDGVLFPEQVERAKAILLEYGTPPDTEQSGSLSEVL